MYEARTYGDHKRILTLKLWDGKSHFADKMKDGEVTNEEGITFYYHFHKIDTYTDSKSQTVVRTRMLVDRNKDYILISTWPFQSFDWQITNEKKVILGYEVQKASAKVFYEKLVIPEKLKNTGVVDRFEDASVIAWFSSELPFSAGPAGYYGLPGVILELSYTTNDDYFRATSIDLSGKGEEFTVPTQGFRITKDQMLFPAKYPVDKKAVAEFYKKVPAKP
jgi:GLPGLI family protein